jgi:hypothetical protein
MKNIFKIVSGVFALGLAASTGNAATTYVGNGSTAWGGGVGNGNIVVNDTASGVLTFQINASIGDNALVIYIDSVSGGFSDNSLLSDAGDPLRMAISGWNGSGRSGLNLPFAADYAIGADSGYAGIWQLASGGNNSLVWKAGVGALPASGSIFTMNVADLGLTANSGQSFNFDQMGVSFSVRDISSPLKTAAEIASYFCSIRVYWGYLESLKLCMDLLEISIL